ncbi:MAG: TolB family protein [Dehalococcoidia bacterium]
MLIGRELHIYRVSDFNNDGDAQDQGKFELVFSGTPAPGEFGDIAPRIVIQDEKVALRELVISGFSTSSRVSRISESGEVIDVARAFSGIHDVLADQEGNIYVWARPPDYREGDTLYKLKAVPEGAEPQAYSVIVQPTATVSFPTQEPSDSQEPSPTAEKQVTPTVSSSVDALESTEITPGIPQMAFLKMTFEPAEKGEIYVVGADGSGLNRLMEGEHFQAFGPCLGSDRLVYFSDEEVPNEPWIYVADPPGGDPKKITEKRWRVWCNSNNSVVLISTSGSLRTMVLYDFEGGQETPLLTGVVTWTNSPDGKSIPFATGLDSTADPRSLMGA